MGEALHDVGAGGPGVVVRWMPALTVGAFLLPIGAGLIGTLLPAFGWLPACGGERFWLDAWRTLVA